MSNMASTVKCLHPRHNEAFPYMETFVRAWENVGGGVQSDINIPARVRGLIGHMGLDCKLWNRGTRLLCLGSGRIESVAWPWCYWNEIVPVMWDVWPAYVEPLCRFVKANKVRLMFCTSRQQARLLQSKNPQVRVEWMPEGIDLTLYPCGEPLSKRLVDVLEYGRRHDSTHLDILKVFKMSGHVLWYQKGREHQFGDFASLTSAIRNSRISICFPQCDTNPQKAGNVETLTQRYWECMLSGTLIAGRAPQELVDLCGYNPVIELGTNPGETMVEILRHIECWQELADKNRQTALRVASWDRRMSAILQALEVEEI